MDMQKSSSLDKIYCLREIREADTCNSFKLGDPQHAVLKSFLKKQAKDLHEKNITKTYVLFNENFPAIIVGYISLVCSEITLDVKQRPKESKNTKRYDTFPAVKLARLAVDKNHQRKGLGLFLIEAGMAIVQQNIMPWVGCRYFIVDSKPNAISFYEKLGFCFLDHEDNITNQNPLMLLDMHGLK